LTISKQTKKFAASKLEPLPLLLCRGYSELGRARLRVLLRKETLGKQLGRYR